MIKLIGYEDTGKEIFMRVVWKCASDQMGGEYMKKCQEKWLETIKIF